MRDDTRDELRRSHQRVYYDAKGRKHTRMFVSKRHHRHRRRRIKRILITVMIVLAVIAGALLGTWKVLDYLGGRELYSKTETTAPVLDQSTVAVSEAEAADDTEDWEDGWVRYNGSVYEYNDDILSFLVMGIDSDYTVTKAADAISGGQADALFLVILNPDTHKIQLLAINRNTMTDIDVYNADGSYDDKYQLQICLAHGYGDGMETSCENEVKAVSNLLYSLPIHGYASINRGAIPMINNAVGGVTLEILETVPVKALSWWSPSYGTSQLTQGETVTLDGTQAYWYTKWRNVNESKSADGRLEREKQYLKQYIQELKSDLKSDPTTAIDLYNAITPYMVTSMDLSEITYLAGQMGGYTFNMDDVYSLPGKTIAGEEGTASGGHDEFYVDDEALYGMMIELFYKKVR